ncbi:MAG: hypothetical protein ACNI3H_00670 [Halarcobacter ebronensis]|uniref:hypothetical protein n=1 Tax=Halarcobacter ebronensis TaxID=1462615 RepID=UPI003C71A29A
MKLKINKPKTRPIQIEPWFFRYLNEGELKVVSAILAHADIRNRQDNSFPSNRAIAFYCGFGLIKEGTKTHNNYTNLSENEKEEYKKKRIKNAIQQVKNIKKELEKKGLLKREITGKQGKQIVFMTLDLEWKKEQYLREYDEYFNDIEHTNDPTKKEEINNELENIQNLLKEDNCSTNNIAQRLKDLSYKLRADMIENPIPIEDIEKVADYYCGTPKVLNKVANGDIKNEKAYKQSIINSIKNNEFNHIEKYYQALQKKELSDNLELLNESYDYQKRELPHGRKTLYFDEIRLEDGVYLARYISKDKTLAKDTWVPLKELKYQLKSFNSYTLENQKIFNNYEINIDKMINKHKKKKE